MDPELKALLRENIKALDANTKAMSGGTSGGGAGKGKDKEKDGGGSVLGTVLGVIKGFTAGLAVVTGAMFAISKFVEAINPGQALLFQMALKDLTATIGTGLVPVLAIITGVVNEISGLALPIVQQLQPILAQFANFIANVVMGQLKVLAGVVQSLVPAFGAVLRILEAVASLTNVITALAMPALVLLATQLQVLAPILDVVADALQQAAEVTMLITTVLTILAKAVSDSLAAFTRDLIGDTGDLRATIKQFGDSLKAAVVQIVILGAAIARFLGFGAVVDRFKKGLTEATERARGAKSMASLDPAIESIAGIGSKIALSAAAAQAGAGAREDPMEAWLKKIAEGIDTMSGDNLETVIVNAIKKANPVRETTAAVETVFRPGATGAERGAAARRAGLGGVGAFAAREIGWRADLVHWALGD